MKIGYARVSTKDQKLEMQTEALEKFGCKKNIQGNEKCTEGTSGIAEYAKTSSGR